MPLDLPHQLVREGLTLLLVTGGPLFFLLLAAGLVVGVFQAATQINDAAFSFLPRAILCGLTLWATGSLLMEQYAAFFTRAVMGMAGGDLPS